MTEGVPLILRFDQWPDHDRMVWISLQAKGGFLEDDGAAVRWSDGTRTMRQQAYGHWLSFLIRQDPAAMALPAATRISQERFAAFLEECEARLKPRSTSNIATSILSVAKALDHGEDWSWLNRAVRRIGQKGRTSSVAPAKPLTAGRVFQIGLRELSRLLTTEAPTRQQSVLFRNALLMTFLISRPVRRRALCAMTTTTHIITDTSGFRARFSPGDMKDHKDRSFPLPSALTLPMQHYLEVVRPVLVRDQRTDFLWVSQRGSPLSAEGLAWSIETTTLRLLGLALNPHVFRHVAATSIAEIDPEHVGIIRDILGHATLDMAERHYNRATGVSSCNALQSIVEDILSNVPRMRRVSRD